MRKRTTLDTIKFRVKEINKYISRLNQEIELSETMSSDEGYYWELKWIRPIDRQTDAEEHIFSGDEIDLMATLTGIEYGIRISNYKYRV